METDETIVGKCSKCQVVFREAKEQLSALTVVIPGS
jgi:uncharacterized C2H2 Zn-finger protein